MRGMVLYGLGTAILLTSLVYAGDYVSWRLRVSSNRQAYGNVVVQPVYVIHEKSGKTEYQFPPPENQVCVQALFPHVGYSPCWYLKKHAEKRIEI
jgi:hypothetical protein